MKGVRISFRRSVVATVLVGIFLVAGTCRAELFTGSGTMVGTGNLVSAEADFSTSGNTLTIALRNTTSGGTLLRGDLLSGIAFDLAIPQPISLNLSSIALTSGSEIFTSKTDSNDSMPLARSWTSILGAAPISQYGVAATGFSGSFSAAGIELGGGGEDYSIAAAGTFPALSGVGTSGSFNASAFPLVQDSLTFNFDFVGELSESQVRDVKFLFGTSGTEAINAVPEPSTQAMWAVLACLGLAVGIRRRARSARTKNVPSRA